MQVNTQPIEKRTSCHKLSVHSVFKTIQGEGPFTGHPAIFVRLAGCNLQCPGCDTDYTSTRLALTTRQLLDVVLDKRTCETLVVITGGEPFRQDISLITSALLEHFLNVQIETNGTLPPSEGFPAKAVVVCSPKTGRVHPELARRANCYKYVMHHSSVSAEDGLPILALAHSAKPMVARPAQLVVKPIYLQPMDTKDEADNKKSLKAVVESCLKYGYTLQLQLHKIIEVE